MAAISEELLLAEVQRRLTSEYPQLAPDRVGAAVTAAHVRFEHSPIRDFVPLLVERRAREALAQSSQPVPA